MTLYSSFVYSQIIIKQMKQKPSSELTIAKEDRKFKKPSSISRILKCSICLQVFHEPTRLFCGHTFCFDCLEGWVKSGPNCPICRQKIDKKNIGKDLLAYSIINQCEVFCIHDDCSWEGTLDMLNLHVFYECLYHQLAQNRPKDVSNVPRAVVDEEIEERINENVMRGNLISRVLMKDNSMKSGRGFDMARKIISSDSQSSFIHGMSRAADQKTHQKAEQGKQFQKKQVPLTNDIDFLMQLYENSK